MEFTKSAAFYFITFLAIFGAVFTVFVNKLKYMLISAFITFISVGLLFLFLTLPFLAVVNIMLYGAGILTVLFFAIVYIKQQNADALASPLIPRFLPFSAGVVLFVLIIFVSLKYSILIPDNESFNYVIPNTKDICVNMFINYGIIFIISGFVFLSSIMGFAVILSKKARGKK